MKPINRDDVPMEAMEEIESFFAEKFPGMKVVCAGDHQGSLPPEVQAKIDAMEKMFQDSMINGTCVDCGEPMPDYDPLKEDWRPQKGWGYFKEMTTGDPMGWQCPECDEDDDGNPRAVGFFGSRE